MTTERDDAHPALSTDELDAVTGGALNFSAPTRQSFLSSRLDRVALNPQPLPPRWLSWF
jgi:hypothetical protein